MNKKWLAGFLLLALLSLLVACDKADKPADTEIGDGFQMTAVIRHVGDRIEVEVLESEVDASGPYWVLTPEETAYLDEDGNAIDRAALKADDKVEIFYSGQVMMSYPPQIVAARIRLVK